MRQLKIFACAMLVLLAAGFVTMGDDYTEQTYHVKMRPGDTIEGISERYYNEAESGECWDAYRWRQLEANRHLWKNDRWPQVGDEVVVVVRVKK